MTNRAVTASSVHQSLEDIGYQDCDKHGEKLFWWMGPTTCPKCRDKNNPNLIPRSHVREMPPRKKAIRDSKNGGSQKRGGQATASEKKGMLTDEQVIELRERYWVKGETLPPLAKEFKTTPTTIHHAVTAVLAYAHIEYMPDKTNRSPQRKTHAIKLTPDEVRAIRRRNANGESYEVLAFEYDRTKGHISDICKRLTWKNV